MNATSAPSAPVSATEYSLLPGINILLEGPAGTGKTTALSTLGDIPGLEVFGLFTEAGLESFLGAWTDRGLKIPESIHWHVLEQGNLSGFGPLGDSANMVNTLTPDALFKMSDPDRAKSNQYVKLLRALANFPDDRTGKTFGDIHSWGQDRCIFLDSLTGINPIAMSLVVGNMPLKSQQAWGIAQDQIDKLLRELTNGCKCHFVLTAHVERETDQVFGGVKVTVSTLGKALAPKIPPLFSDVILSVREGTRFSWSTANSQADLKARNLPIADGISPSFKPIFDKWISRGGRLSPLKK